MFGENLVPLCLLSVLELPSRESLLRLFIGEQLRFVGNSFTNPQVSPRLRGPSMDLPSSYILTIFVLEWNVCFEKDISYVWDIYRYICMRLYEDKFVWDI